MRLESAGVKAGVPTMSTKSSLSAMDGLPNVKSNMAVGEVPYTLLAVPETTVALTLSAPGAEA